MPHKIFAPPGLLRPANAHFPYAAEQFRSSKPGSAGYLALGLILERDDQAALFAAHAWGYHGALSTSERQQHLGGMYALSLLIVLGWRFPIPRHLLAQWVMQTLYEAAVGAADQIEEPAQVIDEGSTDPWMKWIRP